MKYINCVCYEHKIIINNSYVKCILLKPKLQIESTDYLFSKGHCTTDGRNRNNRRIGERTDGTAKTYIPPFHGGDKALKSYIV